MLINNRIIIIFKLSFSLLFFKRTKSPNPLFASNPLIATLKGILPLINKTVKPIDIAQFGIRPITAPVMHCKYLCVEFLIMSIMTILSNK